MKSGTLAPKGSGSPPGAGAQIAHRSRLSRLAAGFRRLVSDPMGLAGLVVVVALVVPIVLADVVATHDPLKIDIRGKFEGPSAEHWLGTDELGRDVFSRVLYGGRAALQVGVLCAFASLGIGLLLGLAAAYGPRWLDNAVVLVLDTVRSYPVIIFALAVGPMFGAGIVTLMGILVVTSVPYYGRIARTITLSLLKTEFIMAEQALGAGAPRVMIFHILPNTIGSLLILVSMDIPVFIATEAGLSFLGVGIRPPDTSWGLMLNQGYIYINHTPWLVIASSVPLVLATLAFTFLGESIRDAFDPKLRREGL